MIPVVTKLQLDVIKIDPDRALLISDVDDVVLHFLKDFEEFIAAQGFVLRLNSLHLNGNIYSIAGNAVQDEKTSSQLVSDFFRDRTAHMKPIDGALDSLHGLAQQAQIILLTNLPHDAGDKRRANLSDLGLPFPVVTNSGPKGPAIRALAAKTKRTTAFVDDSSSFIQSANEYAPNVKTVHFLHDDRMKMLSPQFPFVSLRSDNWNETAQYLKTQLV